MDNRRLMQMILCFSREEAARLGSMSVTADHLTLGILRLNDCDAVRFIRESGISPSEIKSGIEALLFAPSPVPFEKINDIELSEEAQEILRVASVRFANGSGEIGSSHLLAAILTTTAGISRDILLDNGLDMRNLISRLAGKSAAEEGKRSGGAESKGQSGNVIESFGRDLTREALSGKLDPVVGREPEIRRLESVLGRCRKNNPVLIGEPGCGKTAIVEGLAQRIASGCVPPSLRGKRLISIEIGTLVAGTKYRGQFEERIKEILAAIRNEPGIILYFDEIHTIVGAGGSQGSIDAANLLKPALARGEVQCIGATTPDEYRNVIEKDGALERRFQKIMVEPTGFGQTLEILKALRPRYESFHRVRYSDDALISCIKMSERYIADRCMPDKAIDVMDEAGSTAHLESVHETGSAISANELEEVRKAKRASALEGDFEKAAQLYEKERNLINGASSAEDEESEPFITIGDQDIAAAVSVISRIPAYRIAREEGEILLRMDRDLNSEVIGQQEAVESVVRAIRRNRAGLKDPGKPIGSFLFAGPTGVGKTLLAKKLAEYMFGSGERMIRIDMSEYLEKHSVSRLIGAPPGYVGYEDGGQLSEQVRRKPYSVVLLDEIEKAHPDIFNLLLQILDEGRLTDGSGRMIDFRNTIIILTSNIGSRQAAEFKDRVGFYTSNSENASLKSRKNIIDKALSRAFAPEFINRLDETVCFKPLSREDIIRVVEIETGKLKSHLASSGLSLEIDAEAMDFLVSSGYDPQNGARPLKRAIQRYVEDPVSELIIGLTQVDAAPAQAVRVSLSPAGNGTVAQFVR